MTPEELSQKLKEYQEVKDSKEKVEIVLENLMNDTEKEDNFRVGLTLIPNPDKMLQGAIAQIFDMESSDRPQSLESFIEGQYVYRVLSDAHRQYEEKLEQLMNELEQHNIDFSEEESEQ